MYHRQISMRDQVSVVFPANIIPLDFFRAILEQNKPILGNFYQLTDTTSKKNRNNHLKHQNK